MNARNVGKNLTTHSTNSKRKKNPESKTAGHRQAPTTKGTSGTFADQFTVKDFVKAVKKAGGAEKLEIPTLSKVWVDKAVVNLSQHKTPKRGLPSKTNRPLKEMLTSVWFTCGD